PLGDRLAPLFKNGDGVVSHDDVGETWSPTFSEDEAFKIISDIFAENGLLMTNEKYEVPDIVLPLPNSRNSNWHSGLTKKHTFCFDGIIKTGDRNICVEFVSHEDTHDTSEDFWDIFWGAKILHINFKIAKISPDDYVGIFYDPVSGFIQIGDYYSEKEGKIIEEQVEAEEARILAESEELLKMQVTQFIDWLRAENII
ncbi:MAG: hypothetical protein FWE80_09040, partial [Oscillospiraceae bacterium]|nr:hypothetical protein [Oscillospiraceae bacterium]